MSGTVKISAGSLIRKRRDGQVGGGGSTSVVTNSGSGSAPAGGVISSLDDIFEIVNPGAEDEYLRCKMAFVGDFAVQAWSDLLMVHDSHAFQSPVFADPLELDATIYKDFKCGLITDDTTINLNNTSDGDAGMIEITMDSTGGYTVALGTMFVKQLGETNIVTTANADNFISWRNVAGDIVYTIAQVQ